MATSPFNLSAALHYARPTAEHALAHTSAMLADLEQLPSPDSASEALLLRLLDAELLGTRHLVDLGTCSVDLDVRDGRCQITRDGRLILQDVATSAPDESGPGSVDVCYDTQSLTQDRLLIVAGTHGVIATIPFGPTGDRTHPTPSISWSRSSLRQHIRLFDDMADDFAYDHFGVELTHIKKLIPAVTESCYLNPALSSVPDDHLDEILALLRGGGLRAALSNDHDLAETLVVCGAVCQATPMRIFVDQELRSRGLDTTLVDRLLELGARGIPLLRASGEWLFPLI